MLNFDIQVSFDLCLGISFVVGTGIPLNSHFCLRASCKADNITHKREGGGSHGIGKAVFLAVSKIKT